MNQFTPDNYTLAYSHCTLYESFVKTASAYGNLAAYEYMGEKTTYQEMERRVTRCADALCAIGVQKGDRVSISLPNIPQAVDIFYAINRIGAIANMVHPLSAENEIAFFLSDSESVCLIALDQFKDKFISASKSAPKLKTIIFTGAEDELSFVKKTAYRLSKKRLGPVRVPGTLTYAQFLSKGKNISSMVHRAQGDHAVILYSGGTTGVSKGILLTNFNFNAMAAQIYATNSLSPGDKMLAVLPMFHGFGLGVCIHSMMYAGCCAILVPRFHLDTYAKMLKKTRPNLIAGVPTLFEALIHLKDVDKLDLSFLKGVYSGGDSLSVPLKRRIDKFLSDHKSPVPIREGYGLAECISAVCLTPENAHKEGSIGVPVPDMVFKIVTPGTEESLAPGCEGEICISGPTVMLGYVNNEKETAEALRVHADGRTWLHTGDLGRMDEDGYVYFLQRIKRMIVTSGYNVYPSQIEEALNAHPLVHKSCVIGVNDDYRMKRIKAFVVLKDMSKAGKETEEILREHLKPNVARYAMPREIEFRSDLPTTPIGKVAYRVLEEEENAK